ncbi:class I glutamine amidotransferase-like protein [Phyllosticta capitalensis]|uniref:Class I glutamine amidotransferase-like protein n=1 Tax=Phyllosticta capitalensis TaxID=121624 RepID=A0ABR1YQ64_9PEZI
MLFLLLLSLLVSSMAFPLERKDERDSCDQTPLEPVFPPVHFSILLFPAFDALDVIGPLEVLSHLARSYHITVSYISTASTASSWSNSSSNGPLDSVSTATRAASMNPFNSSAFVAIEPTHSLDDPPAQIDALIVPGGPGTRAPDLNSTISFVASTFPRLDYLLTVCTGAGIAARAGVLDGRRVTTNKKSWDETTALRPEGPRWERNARWTEDGKVWTSGGVSAGIDMLLGFVARLYGGAVARSVAEDMEYEWRNDGSWDPFAYVAEASKAR